MPDKLRKEKYKILIDAHKFGNVAQADGSTRYVNSLLSAMQLELSKQFEIFLFFEKNVVPLSEAIEGKKPFTVIKPSYYGRIRTVTNRYFEKYYFIRGFVSFLKNYLFRKKIRSKKFDIVHVLLPHRYYYFKGLFSGTIRVMSILDLTCKIAPQFHLDANIKNTWSGTVYSSKFCEGIICISQNTQKDYLKYFPNYNGKLSVTHLGYDDKIFYKEQNLKRIEGVKIKYGITSKYYILSLFTLEPRKNLKNLILAFELLRHKKNCNHFELVVAGNVGWRIDDAVKLVKNINGVRLIGFVDESDMAPLYSGATVFCYPSFYEGFGLPLLEAMACGTPVVFGSNSSMPEVVGDAGLGCDPGSPKDIMKQLEKICTNDDLNTHLSQRSIQRAQKFSWVKCASETLELYESLINQRNE